MPRGVGNSYQALEDGTAYTYLVNAPWSAELKATSTFVNLADPDLGMTLVHVSSDYVFVGTVGDDAEGETVSALSVSGQSK